MGRGTIRKGTGVVTALTATLWSVSAFSQQQQEGGRELVFNVGTTLTSGDNRDLNIVDPNAETTLDLNLGFHLITRTRLQTLDFSGNGIYRFFTTPESDTDQNSGFQDPALRLVYGRNTGNSSLDILGYYRDSQVNLFEPILLSNGTISSTDVNAITGDVVASGASLALETGINDPVGFVLSAGFDDRNYSDTTDPGVYDSHSTNFGATVRMNPSQITQYDLNLSYSTEDDENDTQTQRQNESLGVGIRHSLSSDVSLYGELGYSANTTDELISGAPVSTDSNGIYALAGASRNLSNGDIGVSVATNVDSVGTYNTAHFIRNLELAPNNALQADIGVYDRPGNTPQLLADISYENTLAQGAISARFLRTVTLNADDVDVATTSLRLGYSHELNAISNLGLSLNFAQTADGGGGNVDQVKRAGFSATYSYDLTKDWDLIAGYEYRKLNQEGSGTANSNTVFLTLDRDFTFLP